MKSRIIAAAITAASLLALPAFAADTAPAPLAPGNPAGTRQAALLAASPFLLLGAVALVVVVAAEEALACS